MKLVHVDDEHGSINIMDSAEINADAMIKMADLDLANNMRFDLSRKWGNHSQYVNKLRPFVLFIGHNPSTADYKLDDPTVREWYHFTQLWGYDKFIAMNLYPFRSSHPEDVTEWMLGKGQHSGEQVTKFMTNNQERFSTHAAHASLIVPCWGNIDGPFKKEVIERTERNIRTSRPGNNVILHCFGITQTGAPMHPMVRGALRPARNMIAPPVWKYLK